MLNLYLNPARIYRLLRVNVNTLEVGETTNYGRSNLP